MCDAVSNYFNLLLVRHQRDFAIFFSLEDSRTRKHSLLKLGLALAFDTGSTFACGPIHIEFFCVFKMDKAGYTDITSVYR